MDVARSFCLRKFGKPMNTSFKSKSTNVSLTALDWVKLIVAVALVAAGIFAYNYYAIQVPGKFLRLMMVFAGIIAGGLVYMTSTLGPKTREFLKESRFELRKMVWPTREEALRTTWVVVIAVMVISLILAFFDLIIQQILKFILG